MRWNRRSALARLPWLAWLALGLALGCHAERSAHPSGAARGLASPYDVEARRAAFGTFVPSRAPPAIGPPVVDLKGVSYYVDAQKSVADPKLKAENEAALGPVRAFVSTVAELSDDWIESQPPNPRHAAQALDALASWARGGALLGDTNRQGEFEREWTLGGLALAYLKIEAAPGLDPARRAEVTAWLARIARAVQPFYARPGLGSNSNNHAYWAGLAVAASGVAAQDPELFDWGLSRARIGIDQVQPNGTLPLETKRGALALHYHVFALTPLVMLAELAVANEIDLYSENHDALVRLADRVIEGLADPSEFEALAGSAQTIPRPPGRSQLTWAEPYFARFRDRRLRDWLRQTRPLRDRRLGGNVTASFGAPTL